MHKKKRTKLLAALFLCIYTVLAGRLAQIQLVSPESFSKHNVNLMQASVNQRIQTILLDDGRGKFYDRDGKPINYVEVPTLLLFPFLKKMQWPVAELAAIINQPAAELELAVSRADNPFPYMKDGEPIRLTEKQMDRVNELNIPGVYAATRLFPMKEKMAEQLLGGLTSADVNEEKHIKELQKYSPELQVGDKGLQEQFDDFLLSIGETRLVYHVDGIGGPLFGIDVKYTSPGNSLYPVKVITTLDMELQQLAEKILDGYKIKQGGLLLLDIESSELRAVASRPKVNAANPNEGKGSKNLMFTQATLGSVFKTVVAAAAIEEQLVGKQSVFNCDLKLDGSIETLQEKKMGYLRLGDSFARSCNRTFGELAKSLAHKNKDMLEKYAEMLQLIGESGWRGPLYHDEFNQLYGEENGQIWLKEEYKQDDRLVMQTGIGQQDVQATPLAVANMMATIARNGERRMVRAVTKVEYANGTTAAAFKASNVKGESIEPGTAVELQRLLRGVVENQHGTAHSLADLPVTVAGKTGTAQTNKEARRMNKWFAGYFPADKPKYAIVVVNLQAENSDTGALGPVKEYISQLSKMEK
ncbi:MAG: peptidoglycan D,D-transpeptidase FtsI family protein [Bacillus sp. (in: firmicutes)]